MHDWIERERYQVVHTPGLTWQLTSSLSFARKRRLAVEPALGWRPSDVWHVGAVILVQVLECYLDSAHERLWSCVFERVV